MQDGRFREALVEAIERLPERERQMMGMHYEQDMNLREIGEVMGVSESRVCQLHSQAVARLRTSMKGSLMDKLSLFGLVVAVTGIIGGQLLEGGSVNVLMQMAAFPDRVRRHDRRGHVAAPDQCVQ